jgi:hypothetical protein
MIIATSHYNGAIDGPSEAYSARRTLTKYAASTMSRREASRASGRYWVSSTSWRFVSKASGHTVISDADWTPKFLCRCDDELLADCEQNEELLAEYYEENGYGL